ncbi:arsenate reductase (glutaredoxin) [Microbulbifer variabilis]|jgi:arsenate reductase|uniref:Arsenate reductase n=1 Tax=Microbulbifer variabilis TaxID=266805 RepID=A0ABY4VFE1_9GAMM|nr:arsenate reductase (glutaredoxin) [Microbulbifer variabilis]USD22827.1 arsenate reductase (glutaredoxin) [Microbulbifer variabilis]
MWTIYHNPRCSKSRQTLQLLQDNGVEPEVILYLQNPPSAEELNQVLQKLGIPARDLLRTGEEPYKQLNLKDGDLDEAQLIKAMVENPILIQRPIVVRDDKATIGRPPENALELL